MLDDTCELGCWQGCSQRCPCDCHRRERMMDLAFQRVLAQRLAEM